MLMNGYSLVPAGNDLVKVIGTVARTIRVTPGVPIISDESLIPPGEQVISFLFKLRFADPTELQQVLGQYLSPPQTYTFVPRVAEVVEHSRDGKFSVIRKMASIINQVDIPPAEVVSEFIGSNGPTRPRWSEMLREVFDRGNQPGTPGTPGAGGCAMSAPACHHQCRAAVPLRSDRGRYRLVDGPFRRLVVVGKIKISADVRTNRIHVITRPVNMPFVRRLIGEFDANVEFAKPVTRPLRYISAADVLPVIVQALTEPGAESGWRRSCPGGDPNSQAQQQQNQRVARVTPRHDE